jgi:hypothetical protein
VVFDDKFETVFHDGKTPKNWIKFVMAYLQTVVTAMLKKSMMKTGYYLHAASVG